jgi:hypothetical protein
LVLVNLVSDVGVDVLLVYHHVVLLHEGRSLGHDANLDLTLLVEIVLFALSNEFVETLDFKLVSLTSRLVIFKFNNHFLELVGSIFEVLLINN